MRIKFLKWSLVTGLAVAATMNVFAAVGYLCMGELSGAVAVLLQVPLCGIVAVAAAVTI